MADSFAESTATLKCLIEAMKAMKETDTAKFDTVCADIRRVLGEREQLPGSKRKLTIDQTE